MNHSLCKKVLLFLCCGLLSATLYAQVNVTGTIIDGNGAPIPEANIFVKGTTIGVNSDSKGSYAISVPNSESVLTFSFVGYKTQEITVGTKTIINVTLEEDIEAIGEVVVVGFGTQPKANLTGAVASISSDAFENRPVANIGQAIQGLIPNLTVSISNGAPNTAPSFNIRGGTTLALSDGKYVVSEGAPLIIVDGVEMSASLLNQMNPNDVENMSVIKDASAAAIYGTKATFGVVLITTKSGKFNQQGKINYTYDVSWDTPSGLPDILDSYTIQKSGMDKSEWTGGKPGDSDKLKLEKMKEYINNPIPENAYYMDGNAIIWVANMNPYDIAIRDWTPTQKHNLNFSGGTDKIAYFMSLGYQDQEGMYKINTDQYKRYNASIRVNAKVKEWFNVEGKVSYNHTDYESPYLTGGKGTLWSAMRNETGKNINMPIMTSANDPIPNAYTDNILGWISYGGRTNSTSYTTSLSISPELIIFPEMLKVKADLSYLPQISKSTRRSPKHEYITTAWRLVSEQSETQEHRAQLSRSSTDTYMINAYIDFNKTFAKSNVSAVLGFNQESVTYGATTANLRGLFSPDIMNPDAAEDKSLHTINTSAQKRTGRAVFGRVNYNYKGRYLFEMNGRYDGSSRFTKDDRYFFFPSFSAGWRISEEPFMAFSKNWLNNLKLRGSWGKLGSQPSGYYPYQATMSSGVAYFLLDDVYVTTVQAPGLVSPYLTWEKAATTNFGLDANFLRNRLSFSLDIFERKTTDILTDGDVAYPSVLGTSAPLVNSGSLKAYGWEMVLEWKDRLKNGLAYSLQFTLWDSRTKVLHYAGNPTNNIGYLYDGAYTGNIWGYETGGILQESDLIPNASGTGYIFNGPHHDGNLYPGYLWYRDINGDGQINAGSSTLDNPGDRRIIGNSTPRYKYGFTANASYKGFDLNLFFQGVAKRDVWTGSSAYWGGGAGSQWMYDRSWTPERTNAEFPMYTAPVNTQTGYLINGAYLRLKQASLGYTIPQSITKKIKVDRLRFHIAGYNLFEITDIPNVFDVDQISDAYPQKRTISIGAQITF